MAGTAAATALPPPGWPSQPQLVLLTRAGGAAGTGLRALGLACGPVSLGGLEVTHRVADSKGWVSRAPPTAPPVFLALLTPRGSWWISVFLLLPASCLLTLIAGHLVPTS